MSKNVAYTGTAPRREQSPVDETEAWTMLRALARAASAGQPPREGEAHAVDDAGALRRGEAAGWFVASGASPSGYRALRPLSEDARSLLSLYAPLCVGASSEALVVAHLGQSLDGRVATITGASQFITDHDDLVHTHRLRALCDAVVVGARTVELDDPRLTTRLVVGDQPVRVILDPRGRLDRSLRVLSDGLAPTLRVMARRAANTADPREPTGSGHVETLEVDADGGVLDLRRLLALLRAHGLRRIMIEGGGVTVSHFLRARLLTRLHVAVAPVIIGSGPPALNLAPIDAMSEALTAPCRTVPLGRDVLFDFDLRP